MIEKSGKVMYEQTDIFSEMYPKFKITKPIRLIELFAGIGSQAKALRNLGAGFTTYKVVEFDKYAIKSYNAIHGTGFQTSDIREIHAADLEIVDRDKFCYIMTYSFPCTDLSVAGRQAGMKKGSGTRSGLLWEVERILDECGKDLPHVLLMENVPMVIAEKNIDDFYDWRGKLESIGYASYLRILNAKDYGIPQNRARCFMVSVLGEYSYDFPQKRPLKLTLKDMLEDDVDQQFYLTEKQLAYFKTANEINAMKGKGFKFEPIESEQGCDNQDGQSGSNQDHRKMIVKGYALPESGKMHQCTTVYSPEGISRTLMARDYKGAMLIEE